MRSSHVYDHLAPFCEGWGVLRCDVVNTVHCLCDFRPILEAHPSAPVGQTPYPTDTCGIYRNLLPFWNDYLRNLRVVMLHYPLAKISGHATRCKVQNATKFFSDDDTLLVRNQVLVQLEESCRGCPVPTTLLRIRKKQKQGISKKGKRFITT